MISNTLTPLNRNARPIQLSPRKARLRKPNVNKSFAWYQEVFVSPRNRRSLSAIRYINDTASPSKLRPRLTSETSRTSYKSQELLSDGNNELSMQNFPKAVEIFSELLVNEQYNIDALYNRAICNMHMGNHKKAVPDLLLVE